MSINSFTPQNIVGSNKIKDDYENLNTNDNNIYNATKNHINGATDKHAGTAVTFTPTVTIPDTNVEAAINKVDERVDNLVNEPDPSKDLELVDARTSSEYGVFATLKERCDNTDVGVAGMTNYLGGGLLINGNFDIWQRGTSFTGAKYTSDRWLKSNDGQIDQSTDRPTGGSKYSLKAILTGGIPGLYQKIENPNNVIYNKKATLSFKAKTNGSSVLVTARIRNASATVVQDRTYTVTSAWQEFELTFDEDTNWLNDDEIWIYPYYNETTTVDLYYNQIKLEVGDIATPFIPKPFAEELRDCQRYYYSTLYESVATSKRIGLGQCVSSTDARVIMDFPERMRIVPTFAYVGNFALSSAINATLPVTNIAVAAFNRERAEVSVTVASGLVQGNATSLRGNADATADLQFDAEI